MFKKNDPYSFSVFCSLLDGSNTIGSFFAEYQVTNYNNVQLKDSSSIINKSRQFLVHCTQKINIYNKSGMDLSPTANTNSYENYPVLINTIVQLASSDGAATGFDFQLLEYSPQTVNTKIQQSGSATDSKGTSTGTNMSNTVGSSTSETNSYGVSVTVGASEGLNSSVSANYEHSSTVTNDQSQTRGVEASTNKSNEASSSAAMSIKDWGAYAMVNPLTRFPSWTFGQEYPWDAVECRTTNGTVVKGQTQIVIPVATSLRLFDTVSVYPPSQLSMFGVNFVMKAVWQVTIDDGTSDEVDMTHIINYFSGSHGLDANNQIAVYMDTQPTILQVATGESLSPTIDLALMAMDPIGSPNKGAVIGFIPSKFTIAPVPVSTAAAVPFKIVSTSNNLIIKDTTNYQKAVAGDGFTSSETSLSASVSANPLTMTLYFKIVDSISDYTLFIKHWKTSATGVMLTLVFNGDTGNPIAKYVDAVEAEGGENNLMAVSLRNQDYATIDYHDYLQLGLNTIDITIQPMNSASNCEYQIRAMAIEKD